MIDFIIGFQKTPHERTTYPAFPGVSGTSYKEYTSKYQCRLLIDLWLITLRFSWIQKAKRP